MNALAHIFAAGEASVLALKLAYVENALQRLTKGRVDAIVDSIGTTYLLRPAQEHLRHNEARFQFLVETLRLQL